MKNFILMFGIILTATVSSAQTNIFPSSGNVGIGTTSPGYKLEVNGQTGLSGTLHTNLAGETPAIFHPVTTNGSEETPYYENLLSYGNSSLANYASIYGGNAYNSTNGTYLQFRINARGSANSPINVMTLNAFGNVGIGTASPSEKLSVMGKIRSQEIKVETTNWPDYVFEPSYRLPALKETEQFIEKNGHLPEIPSAKEVAEDGINLGDMNARLLKKIEELTLYIIGLKKDSERQEQLIQKLHEKIK